MWADIFSAEKKLEKSRQFCQPGHDFCQNTGHLFPHLRLQIARSLHMLKAETLLYHIPIFGCGPSPFDCFFFARDSKSRQFHTRNTNRQFFQGKKYQQKVFEADPDGREKACSFGER